MTLVLSVVLSLVSQAQDEMVIKMNNNTTRRINVNEIREIKFLQSDELLCPIAEAIDLGLPSGTLWASWNIGASAPEECGNYYAWGELEEKDCYDWNTYIQCYGTSYTCNDIGEDISETNYDVAHVKWGGLWQMPTIEQIEELIENCTRTWTQQNGVSGTLVTGPSGNSIFLPAIGLRYQNYLFNEEDGYYFSASKFANYDGSAGILFISSYRWDWGGYDRCIGLPVRAVINPNKEPQANPDCPIAEAIDLGLPSGTKWASWNIGASTPEEYGDYFAWGETDSKENYNWGTYNHSDGYSNDCYNLGDDIAGTKYDVAHVKWGGLWRMPTIEQIKELIDKCKITWTSQNGVPGALLKGPNKATIFLPATGWYWASEITSVGSIGQYWSSSLDQAHRDFAEAGTFDMDSQHFFNGGGYRCCGVAVRPVCP